MDIHRIHSDKAKLVEQHGPWISHNIKLAATVIRYALGTLVKGNARSAIFKLSPISPEDHSKTCEFSTSACGEGLYAIECALHGADTVGIEGRLHNIAKGEFVKEVLGLDSLRFYQDDVRQVFEGEIRRI